MRSIRSISKVARTRLAALPPLAGIGGRRRIQAAGKNRKQRRRFFQQFLRVDLEIADALSVHERYVCQIGSFCLRRPDFFRMLFAETQ